MFHLNWYGLRTIEKLLDFCLYTNVERNSLRPPRRITQTRSIRVSTGVRH